jgi:c-di-GMP-binding flagellar brake protein YcgR
MSWEGLNRRKFPRVILPCLIKFSKEKTGADMLLTHTENISSGGVCVVIKRQLDLFSVVDVEIDVMDGENTIHVKGKTVWTVRRKATEDVKPSFYDTGIEFTDLQEKDKTRLDAIITRLVAAEKVTDFS